MSVGFTRRCSFAVLVLFYPLQCRRSISVALSGLYRVSRARARARSLLPSRATCFAARVIFNLRPRRAQGGGPGGRESAISHHRRSVADVQVQPGRKRRAEFGDPPSSAGGFTARLEPLRGMRAPGRDGRYSARVMARRIARASDASWRTL